MHLSNKVLLDSPDCIFLRQKQQLWNVLVVTLILLKKMMFFIKFFFSQCDQIRKKTANLVASIEEIVNGKLHSLCSVQTYVDNQWQIKSVKNYFKAKISLLKKANACSAKQDSCCAARLFNRALIISAHCGNHYKTKTQEHKLETTLHKCIFLLKST